MKSHEVGELGRYLGKLQLGLKKQSLGGQRKEEKAVYSKQTAMGSQGLDGTVRAKSTEV